MQDALGQIYRGDGRVMETRPNKSLSVEVCVLVRTRSRQGLGNHDCGPLDAPGGSISTSLDQWQINLIILMTRWQRLTSAHTPIRLSVGVTETRA